MIQNNRTLKTPHTTWILIFKDKNIFTLQSIEYNILYLYSISYI